MKILEENVEEFKASYNIKGKVYEINFFDFPASIQIRLAIRGMKDLLDKSADPDHVLELLKNEQVFPGERRKVKHPLYIKTMARIKNVSLEDAAAIGKTMTLSEVRRMMKEPEYKRVSLLIRAEEIV